MNAPFIEPAHSRVGGSVAMRVLRCPASVGLVEKVPEQLRKTSAYAKRGTALHTAMALLLDESGEHSLEGLVGMTVNGYEMTPDDVETALRPAFAYVDALLKMPGAEFYLEHGVRFPTVVGAFGTADLLVRIGGTIHVVDFKFGAGVRVPALYPDGDDDVLNAQLMFYAAAARHSLPTFFAGVENIVLTILQPTSIEPDAEKVSFVTVGHAELDEFIAVYCAACEEALSGAPRQARGDWCRFCGARPICSAHTAPLLNLAEFMVPTPRPSGAPSYLQVLADGLSLVDAIKEISRELHDQAKVALQSVDVVPGYALSAGRAARHWRDESAAIAALTDLGFARSDVVIETVISPRQAEIKAKAHGFKIFRGTHRFAALGLVAHARRERTRSRTRTGRDRADVFRGAQGLPRREAIMTQTPKHNHDPDRVPDNDNGGRAIAPAPAGGALASLKALETALSSVDTSAYAGRSGLPMLLFKREGSGTYVFGQNKTVVEDGSLWAPNPLSFKWGYICFSNDSKAHEHLVPVNRPKPEVTELPDRGSPWQEQMTVNMKCLSGADAGVEVVFKTATDGGIKAVVGLIDEVRDRLNGGEHDGNVVPKVRLAKDSYPHPQYGRIWKPVFAIDGWMPLSGPPAPEPAPAPAGSPTAGGSSAAEQPRRRRVA
jgi:hypothetical protein